MTACLTAVPIGGVTVAVGATAVAPRHRAG
jgi:hypothetical protein